MTATIVRATPARRQASSIVHVPRMFVSNVDTGPRLATPTIAWAARWKTVSTSYSPSTRSISAASQTSPCTTSTRRSVPSRTSAESVDRVSLEHGHARAPAWSALTSQLPSSP